MFGGDSILRIVLVVATKDILDLEYELLLLSAATMLDEQRTERDT